MQFLNENVLYYMLIPTIILLFLTLTNKDAISKIFTKEVLSKLAVSNKFLSKKVRTIFLFLALFLFIISLARPVIQEKEQELEQEVKSIVIAIDVSKSMLAQDLYPSRLKLAKQKLLDIIKASKQNALGVLLFAKSSFILSPITQDFNSLTFLVQNFDTGLNFDNGSNILSVLEASKELLKEYEGRNIILLTDGGNKSDYKDEITFANENNLRVYTLSLASNKPTPIPTKNGYLTNKNGDIVTVKSNSFIKELSLQTKAGYIKYSLNNSDIKTILEDIEKESKKDKLKSKKFKTYTELFYYPIILSLIFLFISFSSLPKKVFLITLCLIGTNQDIKASLLDFSTIKDANKAYEKKEYKEAVKKYQQLSQSEERDYNIANSYYKNKEYKKAIQKYEKIGTSNKELLFKKHHNLGNSYAKNKELKKAMTSYEKALKIKDDKQTKENLEEIKKALKNKDNKKEDKENKKDNKKEDKKNKKDSKDSKDSKDKKDKNKEKSKDTKKEGKKNKKESKDEDKQKSMNNSSKEFDKNEISKLEEKKWMDKLKEKNSPIFLRKFDSKNEDSSINPW